jgi:hypothetical protein
VCGSFRARLQAATGENVCDVSTEFEGGWTPEFARRPVPHENPDAVEIIAICAGPSQPGLPC